MPIIARTRPVLMFEYPKYCSGFSAYSAMSFLAKTNATIPRIKPMNPQQQQVKIDNIPKTRTAVEFGNFCFSIKNSLRVSHFVNIGNYHNNCIQDGQANHQFMVISSFVNKM